MFSFSALRFARVLLVLLASLLPLTALSETARPKKIVLIAGPKSHGPEGNRIHDYPWSVRLLTVMLATSNVREQVRAEFHLEGWPRDPSTLDDADAIMVISDGRDGDKYVEAPHFASPEKTAAIARQIERGCGFLTFHFSTFAPDAHAAEILDWSGGYFDWETDGKPQWHSAIRTLEADVQVLHAGRADLRAGGGLSTLNPQLSTSSPEHPVLRGVKPFRLREEFYYNLRFDPVARPLLAVPALGGREPDGNIVAWARERANGGRGFGTTCGHFYDHWQHADFRKFILNAIVWSARAEMPLGGVEARYFEHDEIMAELDRLHGRAALPETYEEPAAPASALTPATTPYNASAFRAWHRSHGDATSSRFSALDQIDRTNVHKLSVAWTYRSGDGNGNIQCNPIVVNGVMYAPTPGGFIVGVNAETGVEQWRFKPPASPAPRSQADPPARRGLLFWKGDATHSARLFFTAGRWLHAVDPQTGKAVESFGEAGRTPIEPGGTVAGAIFQNVLVVPGYERDIFGYDVVSGARLWTFHTIPQGGEFGADTWVAPNKGANCWGGMALDETRGIAYISTGSPKPDFMGMQHRGRNLFANCVIALDALTGRRLWHFQEVRHDIWDWDIPAPPILTTVEREGRRIEVVAQVTKLGNTFVLDRVTGASLFPLRMRRAPASGLPGEQTWPYQPDPQLPEPFCRQQFRIGDVTTRTPEAHAAVMRIAGRANFGWFAPFEEAKPTIIFNEHGGAEWTGACVDPRSGRLYVSSNEIPWYITLFRDDEAPRDPKTPPTAGEQVYAQHCAACHGPHRRGGELAPPLIGLRHRARDADLLALFDTGRGSMPPMPHLAQPQRRELLEFLFVRDRPQTSRPSSAEPRWTFGGWQKLLDHEGYPGCTPPWGTLVCLDLNTGKIEWRVPLGEHAELTEKGVAQTGTENFGGAIVTAGGLVFCSGTRDGKIRAFDAGTGAELWQHVLPFNGSAPATSYEIHGRQYLVIPATGGGKLTAPSGDAYVAFALPK